MAQAQRLAEDLKKAVAQAERARIERQSQLKLLEVEAAAEEAELQRDLDQVKTRLQKVARKRQDTVSAHERQQAQLNLMLETREATTEKDEALRQCDALERRLHQAWAKASVREEPGPSHGKDLVACADAVGADAVESMLRAESVAMRTAIRFYEKQQEDSDVALEARRDREALWKLEDQQAEEAAELDAAEERLMLGEACIADAFSMVEQADDFHDELVDLAQALSRQKAALEVAQERRDAWQDQASDLRHLLASAEARAAQLEKKLTSSSKSKSADALDALRQSGYQGAAALVVVLARLCGGPRLAFLAIDANNSGAVSTYEFDSALRMRLGLDYEAITGLKLRSLFKAFDTRHCGLVYGVDMVSAFADIWRAHGHPEEVARDPLLNPDLEGPAQDEVLKEQQRWLMEARARRRPRSSSPESSRTMPRTPRTAPGTPRTPRGGRDLSSSPRQASPRELIRDEWQRGYHTVGIPLSPRSLKSQAVTLPGVSPRSQRQADRPEQMDVAFGPVSMASPKANTLAALASSKRESPKAGAGAILPVPKLRLQSDSQSPDRAGVRTRVEETHESRRTAQSPNRAGAMSDSKEVAAKHQQSLQLRAAERARVEEIEQHESRSPNRAGAMSDSKEVAANHQQSLQLRAAERARVEEIEQHESRRTAQSPNRAGAMSDSKEVAAKHQQSLQLRAAERARVEEIEQHESRRTAQSPNRAGAMADSEEVAAKHQQSLQSPSVVRARIDDIEMQESRRAAQSPNRAGAMADSREVAAKHQQSLQSRALEKSQESDLLHADSERPARVETEETLERPESSAPSLRKVTQWTYLDNEEDLNLDDLDSARTMTSDEDDREVTGEAPPVKQQSRQAPTRSASGPESKGKKVDPQSKSLREAQMSQRRSSGSENGTKVSRSPPPGGAGPIPSPEVMSKAARARSLLYVAPKAAAKATATVSGSTGSISSTLGVSKGRAMGARPQNGKKKAPSQSPSATLTKEELARRDSSPPSFLCGRSFGQSEEILLPLRSKDRYVPALDLENLPSPISERGLQDLTRGEQPQLLWERSLSPEARQAREPRTSQISFGKPEHFDTGDRSTASKSPGRPGMTSLSPSSRVSPRSGTSPSQRSPRSPRSAGRSASPYSNRAIYVSDTPWTRPPPSPVTTKAWK